VTGAARPPSVERVLAAARSGLADRDRDAVVAVAREVVAGERARLAAGIAAASLDRLAADLLDRLQWFDGIGDDATASVRIARAINATGVLLHTNLGRASWPAEAIAAASAAAAGPSLLELDRTSGRRGPRSRTAEDHLVALTGGEDALVTNNNAAALALAVGLAGRGGRVAVSRGELVEIGGGVRIPEIVRRAGARLVEVGTTNRTRVADLEEALRDGGVRLILRVHPSNFVQSGFVESPDPAEVATVAHRYGAIVVDDLGSGALLATERFGLAHEPTPRERLGAGADVVTFSGDKLVGGPQAGLVVGRADLIARLRRDPLARAMRPDKATLAAVAATLGLYRSGRAASRIPLWRMVAVSEASLRARAEGLASGVPGSVATPLRSTLGGGSLPGETLPSWGVALAGPAPDRLAARLRAGDPAVIGRIEDGRVLLDLRTVEPSDDPVLAGALALALAG
jgi:L-seryl-tRNA(Ser) seleniumtransferase